MLDDPEYALVDVQRAGDYRTVLGVLRQYHEAVGQIVLGRSGTIEHFAGDGLMAFFNDPTPIPEHELAAIRTAVAVRERFAGLANEWRKRGYELGLGIGVATGYATLGRIGFEGRYDYGAVGTVAILASRLSDADRADEILLSRRTYAALEDHLEVEPVQELQLKGFSRPVAAVRAAALRE
jgi:adenylate cyclase